MEKSGISKALYHGNIHDNGPFIISPGAAGHAVTDEVSVAGGLTTSVTVVGLVPLSFLRQEENNNSKLNVAVQVSSRDLPGFMVVGLMVSEFSLQ